VRGGVPRDWFGQRKNISPDNFSVAEIRDGLVIFLSVPFLKYEEAKGKLKIGRLILIYLSITGIFPFISILVHVFE